MDWFLVARVLFSMVLFSTWALIAESAGLPVYLTTFAFVIGLGMVASGYGAWSVFPEFPISLGVAVVLMFCSAVWLLVFMRSQVEAEDAWRRIAVAVFAGALNGAATVSLNSFLRHEHAGVALGLMNMGTVPVAVLFAALVMGRGQLDRRHVFMMLFACAAVAMTMLPAPASPAASQEP